MVPQLTQRVLAPGTYASLPRRRMAPVTDASIGRPSASWINSRRQERRRRDAFDDAAGDRGPVVQVATIGADVHYDLVSTWRRLCATVTSASACAQSRARLRPASDASMDARAERRRTTESIACVTTPARRRRAGPTQSASIRRRPSTRDRGAVLPGLGLFGGLSLLLPCGEARIERPACTCSASVHSRPGPSRLSRRSTCRPCCTTATRRRRPRRAPSGAERSTDAQPLLAVHTFMPRASSDPGRGRRRFIEGRPWETSSAYDEMRQLALLVDNARTGLDHLGRQ